MHALNKKRICEWVLVWLLYLPMICYFFVHASPHHDYSGFTLAWDWTIADVTRIFAGNDLGDSSLLASQFYENGSFPPNAVYSFRTWAPGIYYLLALPLFLHGSDARVVMDLSVINIAIWALFLLLCYEALRPRLWRIAAFALPITLLLLPEMHGFVLRSGVMNSDAYGTTTLAMAFVALFLAFERRSYRFAVIAGIAFAASAYMRSNHEQLFKIQCIAVAMLVGFEYWQAKLPKTTGRKARCRQFFTWAKTQADLRLAFFILAVAFMLMLPWRIHNLIYDHRLSWSIGVDFEIHTTWVQREPDFWYSRYGGTVGCLTDPVTCQQFNERGLENVPMKEKAIAYARALLTHPLKWYGIKLKAFYLQWMADYNGETEPGSPLRLFRHFLLLMLVLLPLHAVWRYYQHRTLRDAGFCWAAVTLGGYLFVMLTFAHIEPRYLFPIKALIFCWFIIEAANRFRPCQTTQSLSPAARAT